MKTFEISSKTNKKGYRPFKAILHEIYPESCIDHKNQVGTLYNDNGITWIEPYCEQALSSIVGKSLKCEFLDDDRTEIGNHGMTGIQDGVPLFEDATVIGHFTKGYIDKINTDDGEKTVCVGEGEIDASCYAKFADKLDEELLKGNFPECSVEIAKCEDEDAIVYEYGYKDKGRIPKKFDYFGLAILGVKPADKMSLFVELNQKHEEDNMEKEQFDALVASVTENIKAVIAENNSLCEQKVKEAEAMACKAKEEAEAMACKAKEDAEAMACKVEKEASEKEAECNELKSEVEALKAAIEQNKADLQAAYEKENQLYEENKALRKELARAQAAQRVSEMNSALGEFSDVEKSYAKELLDEFEKDPMAVEINSVVAKIHEEIGKKAKEAQKSAEINSAHNTTLTDIDIFGEVSTGKSVEDTNIF